ncbi:hypothetical protein V7S43_017990 [Phytophthora oleae]|uniref:Uncharacterized protein n=1 Tax=Phytophthora oleae TaxID=2107226 RepID=A0ABD3ERI9_9STRA
MQQVRVLVFVHVSDVKLCLAVRMSAILRWRKIGWLALCKCSITNQSDLDNALDALSMYQQETLSEETDLEARGRGIRETNSRIDEMLSRVAAHVLRGHVLEFRPLLAKLSGARRRQLTQAFDGRELSTLGQAENVLTPPQAMVQLSDAAKQAELHKNFK